MKTGTAGQQVEYDGSEEHAQRPQAPMPRHVAIIMDGNGRWARRRGMRRSRGHQEGVQAAKRVIREAITLGVEYLTMYAFSTENWRRTPEEVAFLMELLAHHLRREYDFYQENNIRVVHVGAREGLSSRVLREIDRVTRNTAGNTAITLNLAVNYGGRNEIVRAFNRWRAAQNPGSTEALCEDELARHLDFSEGPDPDLLIRTGGELRLSNFLLWECAYAELYFSDSLWPDWGAAELREALADFGRRRRNYGGMPAEGVPATVR
jgi:undecaprenyl diphosphate synthase